MKDTLVFAKRYNISDPTKIGGAIRLSEELLKDLDTLNESYSVVDINPSNYSNFISAYLRIFIQAFKQIKHHKVVLFMASDRAVLIIAPVVILFCKLLSKRISIKKIGGGFDNLYENASFFKRKHMEWILKNISVLFFETKALVEYFSKFTNTVWFPNVRNIPERKLISTDYKKNFVFVSHVKNSKGIIQILEASIKLTDDFVIHIYGPIVNLELPDDLKEEFDNLYKGALKPEEVIDTLDLYDVVLLPTFYKGEGYPGIIIEAYSIGKPVISTNWNSIPEIIQNHKTGVLINPRSSEELYDAMHYFNKNNYPSMSENAFNYSKQFDSLYQTKKKLKFVKGYE